MSFQFAKTVENAKYPTKGSKGSAGWDLYTLETHYLNSQDRIVVSTGIKAKCPKGYYLRIAPRSGLAVNLGIDVLAGVIDSDYRGEIKIVLYNTSQLLVTLEKGAKIAQLIPEKIYSGNFEVVDDLDDTDRGSNGFGSTG